MLVRELIKKLKNCNPETRIHVCIEQWHNNGEEHLYCETSEVVVCPEECGSLYIQGTIDV